MKIIACIYIHYCLLLYLIGLHSKNNWNYLNRLTACWQLEVTQKKFDFNWRNECCEFIKRDIRDINLIDITTLITWKRGKKRSVSSLFESYGRFCLLARLFFFWLGIENGLQHHRVCRVNSWDKHASTYLFFGKILIAVLPVCRSLPAIGRRDGSVLPISTDIGDLFTVTRCVHCEQKCIST